MREASRGSIRGDAPAVALGHDQGVALILQEHGEVYHRGECGGKLHAVARLFPERSG
jgi:hypothetical protein